MSADGPAEPVGEQFAAAATTGALWESMGVPDIRDQAAQLAHHLTSLPAS